MKFAMKPDPQAGFTLLEIMVALVVFGFLMIGLTQGLHFGLRAWNGQARTIARHTDLDATDRTLRTLIDRMDPGFKIDPPNIIGRPHGFAFTTELPEGAPTVAGHHVDVSLTVDRQHDFILRWTPHIHALRLSGKPAIGQTTMLGGVARVDFGYWQQTPTGGIWLKNWDSREPPVLVRIRIVFVNHGPRRNHLAWPAIVVAPMRQPSS